MGRQWVGAGNWIHGPDPQVGQTGTGHFCHPLFETQLYQEEGWWQMQMGSYVHPMTVTGHRHSMLSLMMKSNEANKEVEDIKSSWPTCMSHGLTLLCLDGPFWNLCVINSMGNEDETKVKSHALLVMTFQIFIKKKKEICTRTHTHTKHHFHSGIDGVGTGLTLNSW